MVAAPQVAQPIVAPRKEGKFWHLVGFAAVGAAVVALEASPRAKPGDTDLASEYEHAVWCAWPEPCGRGAGRTVIGRTVTDSPAEVSLSSGAGAALVFDGRWRTYAATSGQLKPSGFSRRFPTTSRFSPGLDRVAVLSPEDEPTRLEVVATKSGRSVATVRRKDLVPFLVAWAPDGRWLAVAFRPSDEGSRAPDQLVVFAVPL
jgi:hypothetical protein